MSLSEAKEPKSNISYECEDQERIVIQPASQPVCDKAPSMGECVFIPVYDDYGHKLADAWRDDPRASYLLLQTQNEECFNC